MINQFKKYWCIIAIILVVLYVIIIKIIANKSINDTTDAILENLNLLSAPLVAIFGFILGYPLLKQKLVESYITREFDIIHNNNREVKKECLRLQEKYRLGHVSNRLTKEYLEEAVEDMRLLKQLTIDANIDAYKYSYLLYKSLDLFKEKWNTENTSISDYYYCETISNFINSHISEIYNYSQSIGYVYKTILKRKKILVYNLKDYVSDNYLYQVENLDRSLHINQSSALLVLFVANNVNTLGCDNSLLLQCCYTTAPYSSPFVRLMYNSNIYIPPILCAKGKSNDLFDERLNMIGFKRMSRQIYGESKTYYYDCCYANISIMGFKVINTESSKYFVDGYIEDFKLNIDDITEWSMGGRILRFKIREEKLFEYFEKTKGTIKNKMTKEMSK